jgi:hypothetical protein
MAKEQKLIDTTTDTGGYILGLLWGSLSLYENGFWFRHRDRWYAETGELPANELAGFWLRHPAIAVAPPGLVPNLKIFIAALVSRSRISPHKHLCVLTDRLFLTVSPQLEQI